ncbi:MAG: hypothetical protein U0Q55_04055 [Vicinamibacterales bacterium]
MGDTEIVGIDFGGVRARGPAHRVSEGVYRLAYSPWAANFADIELYVGDVIETEVAEHGWRRFTRVVERSDYTHAGTVVGPTFLESDSFVAFVTALQAAGGTWEVPINGWLLTHVPPNCPFDVYRELDHQIQAFIAAGGRFGFRAGEVPRQDEANGRAAEDDA